MTRSYAMASLLVVLGGAAVVLPWLDPAGRRGLALGATVAYVTQVTAYGLLVRYGRPIRAFTWAWAGGMILRLVALAATAMLVVGGEWLPPAPTLLGFVGFLFALLVTEFFFLRPEQFGVRR